MSRALQEAAEEAVAAAKAGAQGLTRLAETVVPRAELEAAKIECALLTAELSRQRQQLEEELPKMLVEEVETKVLTAENEIKRLQLQLERTVPLERLVAAQDESATLWWIINILHTCHKRLGL